MDPFDDMRGGPGSGERERLLLTPGPVHIDPSVWGALEPLHHRSDEFRRIVVETSEMAARLAGAEAPAFLLTMSGTGAMESAIANLTAPGSKVLCVSGGKFGTRWKEIADALGCEASLLLFDPGKRIDPDVVRERVEAVRPEFITLTHVESSTGLKLELEEVLTCLASPKPVIILDAIASLGSEKLEMDEWGIDLVVGAGQKALAAPPGISLAIPGRRARELYRAGRRGLFYNSYVRCEAGAVEGDTPFTPAVQGIQILHRSLAGLHAGGAEKARERYHLFSKAVIDACRRLGLESLPEVPSASVQALVLPEKARGRGVIDRLSERNGIVITGGQGTLHGMIIRTGFLALHDWPVMGRLVSGLADALEEYGLDTDRDGAVRILREASQRPAD